MGICCLQEAALVYFVCSSAKNNFVIYFQVPKGSDSDLNGCLSRAGKVAAPARVCVMCIL
jgi:hypothetical protein